MASSAPQQSPSSNSSSPSPPASPLPSSPPPQSPPPAWPPQSSPPPSSPPLQSPPPSSPPPSSSPPSSSTPASPPPENKSPPTPSTPGNNLSPPPPSQNAPNSSPPPPQYRSPPPPHSSTSTSPPPSTALSASPPPPPSSSSSDDSPSLSINSSIVIGVAVGAGVLVMLLLFVILALCMRKKKKEQRYYGNGGGGEYYKNNASTVPMNNWAGSPQNQAPTEHLVRITPPPGGATNQAQGYGGGNNWNSPPPQLPPQMMTSSDGSSNNFSGGPPPPPPHPGVALGFNKNMFTYEELSAATGGFSTANMIGQGGFGYVHKGVLSNGKEVAVKSLKAGSGQGEKEFQAEVEIISRVHHRHLVSLVGHCIAGGQRMLVYEFIPNKTLEHHLHAGAGRPPLDWTSRVKIALGSAKGLAYLHEDCHPRIIHRDIKSANILIDLSFEAKVADFGLAKLTSDNFTHVSTRIMGTFGYLAPEYASSGKLTEKSDVFSFGVVLLELITGRRPLDTANKYSADDTLVDWARPIMQRALEDGNFVEIADPMMEGKYDSQNMMRMVACAASCIRHSARRRPKMSQIVRVLEGDVSLDDLNGGGIKPPVSSNFGSLGGGSSNSTDQDPSYGEDMRKFKKMATQSGEYTSSEYGATSEYGLDPSSSSDDSQVSRINGNKKHEA